MWPIETAAYSIISLYVVYVDSDFYFASGTMHVIPGGNKVRSVTSLGDDVFVVRDPNQQQIEVYDAKTSTVKRHIAVPRLSNLCPGLAACPYNNCLYASDYDRDNVRRVELSGSNAKMTCSVARSPAGLSLNTDRNLIVVSGGERKLQIFTTHGILLQNVQLQVDIDCPWHAVQLPATSQFLVSRSSSLHRVCLVGVDGAVVRSYGGQWGSELTEMNEPRGLAVDREGRVLVADQ